MFFSVGGGRSWVYNSGTTQGAPSTFLIVGGGRTRVYSSGTTQGARRRCFLALVVGAPGYAALAPPREARRRRLLGGPPPTPCN
jgi:hypothetical protein